MQLNSGICSGWVVIGLLHSLIGYIDEISSLGPECSVNLGLIVAMHIKFIFSRGEDGPLQSIETFQASLCWQAVLPTVDKGPIIHG